MRGLEKSDFSSSVDVGEGSHVHAGSLLRGPGESLEKDVESKSLIVKFLVKKVEIYKFRDTIGLDTVPGTGR